MSVLVLGAGGQVGGGVARGLAERGVDVRPAARTARPGWTRFDWDEPATYASAVAGVEAVHLLPPQGDPDPAPKVTTFLAAAQEAGVRRVVLLSASAIEPGDPGLGQVHAEIAATWSEWAVLRPSWFMQNFSGHHQQAERIRHHDEIVTATGHGRVGFVDVTDIAAVGVEALVRPEADGTDLVITGPEALSYDEVAEIISTARRRDVTHRRVEADQLADWLASEGVPAGFAQVLAGMDAALARGAGDLVTDVVPRVTGRPATAFRDFAARQWL